MTMLTEYEQMCEGHRGRPPEALRQALPLPVRPEDDSFYSRGGATYEAPVLQL